MRQRALLVLLVTAGWVAGLLLPPSWHAAPDELDYYIHGVPDCADLAPRLYLPDGEVRLAGRVCPPAPHPAATHATR